MGFGLVISLDGGLEEIDEFFSGTNAGLNIDLIRGKAEQLIDS